ncbi:hypothetical protein N7517_001560 [Penicillium concentricum]|uniref:Uncharacterized protein n=1 Tax=Penicillium concentricum TaxID=293559 RepID=A0A9W9VK05_9EURO|nr:uncharacterized protein N7517_001560 [Penicillium concentricum]KAJ5383649.1 hypothetical protein N7517_001560 [Penicillium concentricum]
MVTLPSVLDSKKPTAYIFSCFTGIGRPVNLSSPAVGPIVQWKPSAGIHISLGRLRSRASPLTAHAQTPSTVAHLPTTEPLEMSNLSLACIIWRQLLAAGGPPAARIRHGSAWCDRLGD